MVPEIYTPITGICINNNNPSIINSFLINPSESRSKGGNKKSPIHPITCSTSHFHFDNAFYTVFAGCNGAHKQQLTKREHLL